MLFVISDSKPVRTEDCTVNEEESKINPGKETHSQEEEDVAVGDDKTSVPVIESGNSYLPADELLEEEDWDPDYYYDEQDSFS